MFQVSTAKAVELCPERLEVGRTPKSLDNEMERLKIKIASQEEQQGDREEVARYLSLALTLISLTFLCFTLTSLCRLSLPTSRQYHEALESYKNMVQQIKPLRGFIQCLNKVMNQRQQVYVDLRK